MIKSKCQLIRIYYSIKIKAVIIIRITKKDDIKVTIHIPSDLSEIRQAWTNTYCDFAANLLNSSNLPLSAKHQIIDELVEHFKDNS